MTKIRRAAQVVEDLKSLGVLMEDDNVNSYLPEVNYDRGGISIYFSLESANTLYKTKLIQYAFREEFSNDANIIIANDSTVVIVTLKF